VNLLRPRPVNGFSAGSELQLCEEAVIREGDADPRIVVALWIEFDGSSYAGWQYQANGRSIQQQVEQALTTVCGTAVRIHSSGRTDAGVHARAMVAHFKTACLLPMNAYVHGVNRFLPRDVAVREARRVADRFHARFSAQGKWYRYSIYCAAVRSPLRDPYHWQIRKPLNFKRMEEAAAFFVGEHDFSAFRGSGCTAKRTRRRIDSIALSREGDQIHVDVRGSGFLRHMVRMMVGTLVEVGMAKREPADVERLLLQKDNRETRLTAPAQGLCLMQVDYPPELLNVEPAAAISIKQENPCDLHLTSPGGSASFSDS
jgi:tRNA pseudouridine38-40 synthase